jgi:phosphatidylserine/phosphatidylglycerophosphate/cardiolipin synthase-like enzyme
MTLDENPELVIAATGSAWTGKGVRSIWSLIRESFRNAQREIIIAAYSLSESPDFYKILDDCLIRGIRILLIVNRFDFQTAGVKNSLISLGSKYDNFILKDFNPTDRREDLHAKIIVIDHCMALIGSANPTWKGMIMNHEIMVRISGRRAAEIAELVDRLSMCFETKPVPVRLKV